MTEQGRVAPPRIALFDCNLGMGESGLGARGPADAQEACAILDRYGIAEALVYDIQDVETGRFDGSGRLAAFCDGSSRPHPSVPMAPPETGEQPATETWLDSLAAAGVRAVRAFPDWHHFDFLSYCLGPALEALQRRRMPVLVTYFSPDHGGFFSHRPNWDHIARTATAFPDLPIVVLQTGMLQSRNWLPLMRACPNVRCDMTFMNFGLVELVCRRLGPERLVFGTGFPYVDASITVTGPHYADIPERAARRIAGDNLRALLSEVR